MSTPTTRSFEYTDDEDQPAAYYNANSERDAGKLDEARETLESVIRMEGEHKRKAAGADDAGDDEEGGCRLRRDGHGRRRQYHPMIETDTCKQ